MKPRPKTRSHGIEIHIDFQKFEKGSCLMTVKRFGDLFQDEA